MGRKQGIGARRGFRALSALAACAVFPAACSEPEPEPARAAVVGLPTAAELPLGPNRDCGCVRRGECVVLEERLGRWEVRGLSCRWLKEGEAAHCDFESRFVALDSPGGKWAETPGKWIRSSLRAIHPPEGGWCAG